MDSPCALITCNSPPFGPIVSVCMAHEQVALWVLDGSGALVRDSKSPLLLKEVKLDSSELSERLKLSKEERDFDKPGDGELVVEPGERELGLKETDEILRLKEELLELPEKLLVDVKLVLGYE